MKILKSIWQDKRGMGTVEIVLLIAVLVGIALFFKGQVGDFVQDATGAIFGDEIIDKATNP